MEKATFGAGCFWHVEEAFRKIKGVVSTSVGYMGGTLKNPSYEEACTNKTGHAEVVQIEFELSQISYNELLGIFWNTHNPTTPNRQGPDIGTQYRSVIFYHNNKQKKEAIASKLLMQGKFKDKIATEILPAQQFYKAEEYHQKYLQKRGLFSCPA